MRRLLWRQKSRKHPECLRHLLFEGRLFADIGHQTHEAGALHGDTDGALERGAGSAALAAEKLALAGAEFLKARYILEIHKRGPRTSFFRTEAATVLFVASQFLLNHAAVNLSKRPNAVSVQFCRKCYRSDGRDGRQRFAEKSVRVSLFDLANNFTPQAGGREPFVSTSNLELVLPATHLSID